MNEVLDKIVIDCQLLQTGAWDRGMGKYCLNLLTAISEQKPKSSFILILNKHIPTTKERINVIRRSTANAEIVQLDLSYQAEVRRGREDNKTTLNKFMKGRFGDKKVPFIVLSNFTFDYVAAFPDNATKCIILYDLIPLTNWSSFKDMFEPETYFEHFRDFAEADIIFSISESAKQDAVEYLGTPSSKIFNISGANIPRENTSKSFSPKVKDILKERFILFPSADFAHKNNENLAKGFESFNRQFGLQFKLVITSRFSERTQCIIKSISPNITFTGNISDHDYQELLNKCEAVAFVSSSEGLGLPLLEAVSANKPVIASTIKPHQEISRDAFYYCDPDKVQSISSSILKAMSKEDWEKKSSHYATIKQQRTWIESAKKLCSGLSKLNIVQNTNETSQPKTALILHLDPPQSSEECLELQKYIIKRLSKDHSLSIVTPQHNKDMPIYLGYLGVSKNTISDKRSCSKEVHILSNATNLYSIIKASLSNDIVILNLRPKTLVLYMRKKGYLIKGSESYEAELTKIFDRNKLYTLIDLPKQFSFVKKAEDLQL